MISVKKHGPPQPRAAQSRPRAPAPPRRSSLRGWITLAVLVVIVAAISPGPGILRDFVAGVLVVRAPAPTLTPPPVHADAALQSRLQAARATRPRGTLG